MTLTLRARDVDLRARTADGQWRWRLRAVSLACAAGERIGVLGANGAGKSSLARVLCGLERPSRGRARVEPGGGRVMLVMQRPEEHFVSATVHAEIEGFTGQRLEASHTAALLKVVGADPAIASCSPRLLSTGEQRAVAIACALATGPSFLILDEPMAGLDATARRQTLDALRAMSEHQRIGVILISHHPDDLLGWAQRVWILAEGAALYDGPLRSAPVVCLRRSLDESASSLYLALRTLEEDGLALPAAIYDASDPAGIARALSGAVETPAGGRV